MIALLKKHWKYILAGLAAPVAVALVASRAQAHSKSPVIPPKNPYANLQAFLITIQYAEGTYGSNAYRVLYGGGLFEGFGRHPNKVVAKWGFSSTAAGAYQILYRTWQTVQQALGLEDFSPASQDKAAIELIRRRGALEDVLAGRFAAAVSKCRKEWASFPGAGYGQGERSLGLLAQVYQKAGGYIT
jgi:lysozyme